MSESQGDGNSQMQKDIDYLRGKWREAEEQVAQLSHKEKQLSKEVELKSQIETAAKEKEEHIASALSQKDEELAALRAKLESVQKSERERVDKMYDDLPEASREKLSIVKDKLDFEEWSMLVDKEVAGFQGMENETEESPKTETPPHVAATLSRGVSRPGHEPTPEASRILEDYMMSDDRTLRTLKTAKDPNTGNTKFFVPVREMYDRMLKKDIHNVSAKSMVER